jgi:subtilisin family serine protease
MMISLKSKLMGLGFMALSFSAFAQKAAPANWFNLDLTSDNVHGVSTEKAYKELLNGKKPKKTVLVAVIDSGVDYEHEDLKDVMWVNPKEIKGNGKDDDGNGYADDIYGWNFIGGKNGNIDNESLEMTRVYAELKAKTKRSKKEEAFYTKLKEEIDGKTAEAKGALSTITTIVKAIETLEVHFGNSNFKLEDLKKIADDASKEVQSAKEVYNSFGARSPELTAAEFKESLDGALSYYKSQVEYNLNPDFNPRPAIIGDDYANQNERLYGNSDCIGPDAEHGTHVAGIIGAVRNNSIGMDGVANSVRIMSVRAVPNGDERDKDVANAIRYAVDNGAEVINMSFGKSYSYNKKLVDAAVKYAEKKGVLLVHAAGNDSKHIDVEYNFPSKFYQSGSDPYKRGKKSAKNWIEVGALSWKSGADAPAVFSNFGKNTVDLFAPGVDINSTIPGSKYKPNSGTSMAAPVVAGVAALVKSYYPELSAAELKICLEKSVTPISSQVNKPGTKSKVDFKELSITGGVVNVYAALKLAEEMVAAKKK